MAELIAILTAAKEAGFETGTIMSIGAIGFALHRMTNKQVDKVVKAIEGHNTRLHALETDVSDIKKTIKREDKK